MGELWGLKVWIICLKKNEKKNLYRYLYKKKFKVKINGEVELWLKVNVGFLGMSKRNNEGRFNRGDQSREVTG